MDYQGSKDRVYGRFIHQKDTPVNGTGTAWAGFPGDVPSVGDQAGLDWTRNFTPTLVNEARLAYGRLGVEFGGNSYGNTLPQQGDWAQGLASISTPSGYAGFGYASNLPQGRIVNTYQLQDNLSWMKGKHTIKAGANLTYQRSPNVFPANENGTYGYSTIADYIQDIPSSVGLTVGNPELDFREHEISFMWATSLRPRGI